MPTIQGLKLSVHRALNDLCVKKLEIVLKTGSVAGEVTGRKQYEQSTEDNSSTYHK